MINNKLTLGMTLKVKQHFVSARMRKSRNPNVHKNAQESEFCFLQSACRFPDFTLFF